MAVGRWLPTEADPVWTDHRTYLESPQRRHTQGDSVPATKRIQSDGQDERFLTTVIGMSPEAAHSILQWMDQLMEQDLPAPDHQDRAAEHHTAQLLGTPDRRHGHRGANERAATALSNRMTVEDYRPQLRGDLSRAVLAGLKPVWSAARRPRGRAGCQLNPQLVPGPTRVSSRMEMHGDGVRQHRSTQGAATSASPPT